MLMFYYTKIVKYCIMYSTAVHERLFKKSVALFKLLKKLNFNLFQKPPLPHSTYLFHNNLALIFKVWRSIYSFFIFAFFYTNQG